MIKAKNAAILQENCLACHGDLVHELVRGVTTASPTKCSCVHCHRRVGHGEHDGPRRPASARNEIEGNAS